MKRAKHEHAWGYMYSKERHRREIGPNYSVASLFHRKPARILMGTSVLLILALFVFYPGRADSDLNTYKAMANMNNDIDKQEEYVGNKVQESVNDKLDMKNNEEAILKRRDEELLQPKTDNQLANLKYTEVSESVKGNQQLAENLIKVLPDLKLSKGSANFSKMSSKTFENENISKVGTVETARKIITNLTLGHDDVEAGAKQVNSNAGAGPQSHQVQEDQLARIEHLEHELKELKGLLRNSDKTYLPVKFKNYKDRRRVLVTGGTGFVGSHLVDRLMLDGHEVIALDNHFTGRKRNVEHWMGHPNFELVHHDIVNPFFVEVDQVYHLASPASPPHYMYNPVKTLKTNTLGTINMLGLARRTKARMLLASTSEVYGDPEVHPQPESYWGHVNPIGPRSCYDEGKRAAESLMVAYQKQEKVDIRIARIFNTFGPRMHMNDGRVVSNFILQALKGEDITIYGDGNQTRSFQYVTDLVDGLVSLMKSDCDTPVNIGNPEEHTVLSFATIIRDLVGSKSKIVHEPAQTDDPRQRKPDISKAAKEIDWTPKVSMVEGLKKTVLYFREELEHNRIMGLGERQGPIGHPLEHYEAQQIQGI